MTDVTRFKIGDLVVLKSGGPPMTVCSNPGRYGYDNFDSVETQWFEGVKPMKSLFPVDALKLADS